MGGIGNEAAALPLGVIQPFGQQVELPAQIAELVPAGGVQPVAVIPGGHDPHGNGQRLDTPDDGGGEHQRQRYHNQDHHHRDHPDLALGIHDDVCPLHVLLQQIHGPGDGALAADGDGAAAEEGLPGVVGAEHRLAAQGGGNVRLLAGAGLDAGAVVYRPAVLIHNHRPVKAGDVQQPQHFRHAVPVRLVQLGQGSGENGGLARNGALLLQKYRVPGGNNGEQVQQQQQQHHYRRQEGEHLEA